MMWQTNGRHPKIFTGGTQNYLLAAEAADTCRRFTPDDEDEQVCDDPRSCYNCRYRRWLADTIACMGEF